MSTAETSNGTPTDRTQPNWASAQWISFLCAAIGLGTAALSFQLRRTRPQIRANVQENALRRSKREAFNQAVRQRNQVRLDRTRLIVTPVGIGQ